MILTQWCLNTPSQNQNKTEQKGNVTGREAFAASFLEC